MTNEEKATKIEQVKELLLKNGSDMLNVGRHYKSTPVQIAAKQELRVEQQELQHQLEQLMGITFTANDLSELLTSPESPKDDGGPEKGRETVKV